MKTLEFKQSFYLKFQKNLVYQCLKVKFVNWIYWETGTTKWEKRNLADEIPIWQSNLCTQCNYCTVICPHAAIRAKVVESDSLNNAPSNIESLDVKARDMKGQKYILQVAPEDCTGCNLCVEIQCHLQISN